jgi:hypothetical protein
VPAALRLGFGAALLLAVAGLAASATSRHSYRRTRLAAVASLVILALDATAITTVVLAGPARTWVLSLAAVVSMGRIAVTARMLPRLAVHLAPHRKVQPDARIG